MSSIGAIVPERRYTLEELDHLRRTMLLAARMLPPGPERNDKRQIASSLRSLFKDLKWLAANTK